jgi:hypothetical protein
MDDRRKRGKGDAGRRGKRRMGRVRGASAGIRLRPTEPPLPRGGGRKGRTSARSRAVVSRVSTARPPPARETRPPPPKHGGGGVIRSRLDGHWLCRSSPAVRSGRVPATWQALAAGTPPDSPRRWTSCGRCGEFIRSDAPPPVLLSNENPAPRLIPVRSGCRGGRRCMVRNLYGGTRTSPPGRVPGRAGLCVASRQNRFQTTR